MSVPIEPVRKRVFSADEERGPSCRIRGRKGIGFTLIELLVIVALIAILVALLLPSLKSMRERMRSVQCVNNLRQIYTAVCSYAEDNKGSFPAPITWWRLLGNGGYAGPSDPTLKCNTTNWGWPESYPRWSIFRCPGEKGMDMIQTAGVPLPKKSTMWDNDLINCSYYMNWSINGYDYYTGSSPRKMSTPLGVAPGAAWLYIDCQAYPWIGWNWNYWAWGDNNPAYWADPVIGPNYRYAFRHPGNRANVVFFDGHVGTRQHPQDCGGKGVFVALYPCDPSGFTFYDTSYYSDPNLFQIDSN